MRLKGESFRWHAELDLKRKKKQLRAISTPAKLKRIWQLFGEVVNKVSLKVQHTATLEKHMHVKKTQAN